MRTPPILLIGLAIAVAVDATAADPTPPEKYQILSGEDFEGSGFVIRHSNTLFGVASLHQFDGQAPAMFESAGDPVRLNKKQVWKQNDVQVLPVVTSPSKLQFLAYSPEFSLRPGEEVILFGGPGDVVTATLTFKGMGSGVYKSSYGPRELEARANKPFMAAGGSGGPIILKRTGAVVGVLLSADDAQQARVVGFETLCLGVSVPKPVTAPVADAGAERLAKAFPSLFWYAADACLRETTRASSGQFHKHDDYVKSTRAVIEHFEGPSGAGKQVRMRLRLYDPATPGEYWLIELTREGNQWRPDTGYKYLDEKRAFDLFKDEFLAGAKVMGSMKPYVERALAAHSEGKDIRLVFTNKPAVASLKTGPQTNVVQLVGRWRYDDPASKVSTFISFKPDGIFYGAFEQKGKLLGSFSGKWTLKNGNLSYEYTGSTGVAIPVGTKDQDRLIALTKDRYTIMNAAGVQETYVRIE